MEDKVVELNNKIKRTHELEDEYNKEIGVIDKQLKYLPIRKKKLQKLISKVMLFRNQKIESLQRYKNGK